MDRTTEPEAPTRPTSDESKEAVEQRGLHSLSLVFEISNRIRSNLIPAVFASFSVVTGGIIGLYIGVAIFAIAIVFSTIRFLTFRYRLTSSELLIDQGLLFRTHRSVPLSSIQNIDSVQNIFHRIFRVAEVRIETASGNEPEATMRVLSVAEVDRLRDQILVISKGKRSNAPSLDTLSDDADSGRPSLSPTVLEIPTIRLILAGLLSNRGQVLAGIAFGYFWQAQFAGFNPFGGKWEDANKENIRDGIRGGVQDILRTARASLEGLADSFGDQSKYGVTILLMVLFVLLFVFVLRLFSAAWYVVKFYGYKLTLREDELHIRCGLFTKISATIPRHRIQVISVHRSWLARLFGLASVRVETSGGGASENGENAAMTVGRQWFVPIMAMKDIGTVLVAINPKVDWDSERLHWYSLSPRARQRMFRLPLFVGLGLLLASGVLMATEYAKWSGTVLITAVAWMGLSAWMSGKKSRSRKYASSDTQILLRTGVLMQKTSIGFLDRIQSVDLVCSPFDRNWNMATLRFDTAGAGPADHTLAIEMLDSTVATNEFYRLTKQLP